MTIKRSFILALLAFGGLVLDASAASAQQRGAQQRGAPRVIQIEEMVFYGRVQKPNAFYILNRSSIGYALTDLRMTFIPEILRSVRDEPF